MPHNDESRHDQSNSRGDSPGEARGSNQPEAQPPAPSEQDTGNSSMSPSSPADSEPSEKKAKTSGRPDEEKSDQAGGQASDQPPAVSDQDTGAPGPASVSSGSSDNDPGKGQSGAGKNSKGGNKNKVNAGKNSKNANSVQEPGLHGAGIVMESRGWYRDKFRQVVTICMVLVGILGVSFITNVVLAVSRPEPVYFAVSDDLRIKQLTPLDQPSIGQSALFNWTTRTITETFSLDFVHWREQLMNVKPEYTEDCFRQLISSLKNAGNLQMIKDRRLVLSSVVKRAPVVTAKGVVDGHMVWKMEFPISFSYESSERVVASQDLLCTVMVRRVSTLDHPRGVRMAQIVLK